MCYFLSLNPLLHQVANRFNTYDFHSELTNSSDHHVRIKIRNKLKITDPESTPTAK
jgi:hypothetical protein